jgi:ATP-binding protein involved in chromosome partitioning
MIVPIEQYGVKLVSIGFLSPSDSAIVWRGPMAGSALKQFMADADWGELDYLLIDLPPGTSDIHLTLVQTVPVTGAVLVTTPQKVALADAIRGFQMFKQPQINVPVLGLLGQIPLVQGIRESGDEGYPSVLKDDITSAAFVNLAQELARRVAIRNATIDKTQVVEIKN